MRFYIVFIMTSNGEWEPVYPVRDNFQLACDLLVEVNERSGRASKVVSDFDPDVRISLYN